MQAPMCYPAERQLRLRSISALPGWPAPPLAAEAGGGQEYP
ncbi:hypothetical protein HaLaN_20780, partial [Haematococcus lacustris]